MDRLTLLVLEDAPLDAELELEALATAGFACETTLVDGRGAFENAFNTGRYDAVIADYSLPGFTGLAALEYVRRSDNLLPFILVSGTVGEERAIEALRAGATDYVLKDRLARLGPAMRRALADLRDRRRHLDTQQALELSEQRLRRLSRRLLEVQEAERRHLARELHDEIGQALTAIKLHIEALGRAGGDAALRPRFDAALEAVGQALERVRHLATTLRPAQLDELGLAAALRSHLDRQAQLGGFVPRFSAAELPGRLDPAIESGCFRIAQEALTNVLRHAHAANVWVRLALDGDVLVLAVRDDGRGYDVQAARRLAAGGDSLGLAGMQERVELLGGTLELGSAPGGGSEVVARIPLRSG
jgi:signal transduction histidine kinase